MSMCLNQLAPINPVIDFGAYDASMIHSTVV
jgi:hypothetical protein